MNSGSIKSKTRTAQRGAVVLRGTLRRSLVLGVVASCLWSSTTCMAADWLQFRGSAGDGESRVTDLPTAWTSTEHVAWRCELPGEGWSSPVVVGDRILLSAAIPVASTRPVGDAEGDGTKDAPSLSGEDLELALLIVDGRSGRLLKRVALFTEIAATAPKIHSKNSHASPTPIVSGDRVYLHFGHLGTACTSVEGEVLWKNDHLVYKPVHGNGGSPVLVGQSLIFTQDGGEQGKVIALDAQTGKTRWEVVRDVEASKKFSFSTPLVLDVAGKTQVIVPGSNIVQSLDPETGQEIWRVRYEGYSVIPRPIVAAGLVLVSTSYDRPTLLAIRPDGQGDVTDTHVAWQTNVAVPHTPSLNAHADLVFMVSDKGIVTCLEAETGKEVWKERIGGNFSASPLLAGDELYLLSEEGDTTVVKADREYQEVSRNKLGERTLASMAVIDHDLLIRSAQALYRITKQ